MEARRFKREIDGVEVKRMVMQISVNPLYQTHLSKNTYNAQEVVAGQEKAPPKRGLSKH